jgi:hypothetical protein
MMPTMPDPERFTHGTRSRYVTGCRCDDCRDANRVYENDRNRARIYGHTSPNPFVDAAPVRAHLLRLTEAGLDRRTVADAADVPPSTVAEVIAATKAKLRTTTAQRLLAVTVATIAAYALPATPAAPARPPPPPRPQREREPEPAPPPPIAPPVRLPVLQFAHRDDVFVCTKLHTKLRAGSCADRQVAARADIRGSASGPMLVKRVARNALSMCRECPVGVYVVEQLAAVAGAPQEAAS